MKRGVDAGLDHHLVVAENKIRLLGRKKDRPKKAIIAFQAKRPKSER